MKWFKQKTNEQQLASPYLDVVGWMIRRHRLQQLLFLHQLLLQRLDVVLVLVDLQERLLEIADLSVHVLVELVESVNDRAVLIVKVLFARQLASEVHLNENKN